MLSYQQVASLAIIIAIFGVGLVECQIYTENTVSFNSTTPFYASSFGVNYPTNTSVSAPRTKFASVRFNVSDATFVDTSAFFQIVDTIVYKTNTTYTSATAGPITGSFGAIVPPCFPANRSESYFFSLEFNATTNAVYGEATYVFGEDDIPTITNGSSFEVGCRVPGLSKCNDYYSLSISATPISALYTLSVESPTNLTLYFYPKNNNTQCDGLPYTIIANKLEAIGLPVIDAPLDFWLGVQTDDGSSPEVKMWWTLLATDSPSGDNTPQAQTPDTNNNTPSNNIIDELPRWAIVLLIIFGIAVLLLTIVVIVMCVKRNKRAQYSTM